MKKKVAINGLGRIGRLFLRQALTSQEIEVVAVNDLGEAANLAYLLKYDTVYGTIGREVSIKTDKLIIDDKEIKIIQEPDPFKLPWEKLEIDLVVEATGMFTEYKKARAHLEAGAKRVVITAPAKDEEGSYGGKTVLVGVNEEEFKKTKLTCNGSCTTNAAAAIVAILEGAVGVEKAILATVHGYTATQSTVDGLVKGSDFRKGRAAAQNIIPTTTGAAIAVSRACPSLQGKFDGIAFRVPTVVGSIADITLLTKKETTVEAVNEALKEASLSPIWRGIFTVTAEPIVSSDVIGAPYGAIADLSFTKVVGGNLVKVLSWYDNEWGYASMLLKHVERALQA